MDQIQDQNMIGLRVTSFRRVQCAIGQDAIIGFSLRITVRTKLASATMKSRKNNIYELPKFQWNEDKAQEYLERVAQDHGQFIVSSQFKHFIDKVINTVR